MKLLAIYAAVPGFDPGVGSALRIVTDCLTELGEPVNRISLSDIHMPYYDGRAAHSMQPLLDALRDADGVLFAVAAGGDAPCALAKAFFEHMDGAGRPLLKNKSCLLLTVGNDGGEYAALDYLSRLVHRHGGFDAVRICAFPGDAAAQEANVLAIERQAEDYFRILRQNRHYAAPRLIPPIADTQKPKSKAKPKAEPVPTPEPEPRPRDKDGSLADDLSDEAYAALFGDEAPDAKPARPTTQAPAPAVIPPAPSGIEKPQAQAPAQPRNAITELYEKHKQTAAGGSDEDVSEITQFFAQKYLKTGETLQPVSMEPVAAALQGGVPAPKAKSIKQMTQSLPHSFDVLAAAGVQAVFQISIYGAESFEGYISIQGGDCEYADGQAEHHDISIQADTRAWADVLKGKHTAQRAFMMGHLKVRGNFVLLTKFDQIFKSNH